MTAAADAWLLVDETRSRACQVLECGLDVGDGEGDVVKALASFGQESSDGGLRGQRLQKLKIRAADGNHPLQLVIRKQARRNARGASHHHIGDL